MRTLLPTNSDLLDVKDGIFLAGPATRSNVSLGWREDMIKVLNSQGFTGDIINPENPNYGEMEGSRQNEAYSKQTKWEQDGIKIASYLIFWIPRTKENPALTTNIEIGPWLEHPRAFIGWPPGSIKNRYIAERCRQSGKKIYSTMEEMVSDIMLEQNRPSRVFFTSDTHFGAERTLKMSARPFRNVEEMDLALTSNWNKKIRSKDIVFHLGDFGDYNVLRRLNCLKLYLVLGNYEKDGKCKVSDDPRIQVIPNGKKIKLGKNEYRLVHKPIGDSEFAGDDSDFRADPGAEPGCRADQPGL